MISTVMNYKGREPPSTSKIWVGRGAHLNESPRSIWNEMERKWSETERKWNEMERKWSETERKWSEMELK